MGAVEGEAVAEVVERGGVLVLQAEGLGADVVGRRALPVVLEHLDARERGRRERGGERHLCYI